MIRFYLLFLFFLSSPLFAQDSADTVTSSQGNREPIPLNELTAGVLLQQLQKKTVFLHESIIHPSLFVPGVAKANEIGVGKWLENFTPGPLFNGCSTLEISIRCLWSFLRLDRLLGVGKTQIAQTMSDDISIDNFKEEIRRVMTIPAEGLTVTLKGWLLLFAVEFYDWAIKTGVSHPEKLFSLADDLAERLLLNSPVLVGVTDSPLLLYALHRYFLRRGFEEKTRQVEMYIKKIYLHRNDGSEMDLQGKALFCKGEKLAGVHKNYLTENELLFPDYGGFEKRTTSEDMERVQECEKSYHEAMKIHHLNEKSLVKVALYHYDWIIFVLYKVFGKDAVRHFVHHNPLLFRRTEVPPFNGTLVWFELYQFRVRTFVILRDMYEEDDIEGWQRQWQSVIDAYKEELKKNLLTLYSNEVLVSYAYVMQFTLLSLLEEE